MTTNQTAPVTDEELDQMIWKLERDGMTPKQLSLMRELREVRRAVKPTDDERIMAIEGISPQFKPVADLYGITSPTGSETSFTFDANEAANFIEGGWSVQEYVELERYQEAMIGNSPATPDGWIPVSEHSMLPPLKYLDIVKFNADCAIQDPESIYANEFFLSLDEVFGEIGNYSEPVQAKAVSALIAEVFRLSGYSPAAPKEVG